MDDDVFGDAYRPAAHSMSGAPTIPVSATVETAVDDAFVSTTSSSNAAASTGATPSSPSALLASSSTGDKESTITGVISAPVTCVVSDPEKHGENAMDQYISYSITTTSTLSTYSQKKISVRRRYQDFLWLRDQLSRDYPASILPPLPEKNRLSYLDRFSDAFVSRRQAALQRFLDRLTLHPILYRADNLRLFLEAKSWGLETAKQLKKVDVLEDLGDVILNNIYKVKTPDERFVTVFEYITKLDENLALLEKLYSRIVKRQTELADLTTESGALLTLMSATEETLAPALNAVGRAHEKMATAYKQLADTVDTEVLDQLRDYIIYCYAVKATLIQRDQRQIVTEEITEEVEKKVKELEAMTKPDSAAGRSISLTNWNPFKSKDPAAIDKLKASLAESEKELSQSTEIQKNFGLIVLQEVELFNRSKSADFRLIFTTFTRAHVTFLKQGLSIWKEALPAIEALDVNAAPTSAN